MWQGLSHTEKVIWYSGSGHLFGKKCMYFFNLVAMPLRKRMCIFVEAAAASFSKHVCIFPMWWPLLS
jgi:hypothetical protein